MSSLLGGLIGAAGGFLIGGPMGAVAGASLGSSIGGAKDQASAAKEASQAQVAASQAGIVEQRRQFDVTQKLLSPYVQAGAPALAQQQSFLGLSGPQAQQQAIQSLQQSPQFTSLLQQGENAILQNAAATGGLRGGNVQGALAQFRPQLLNQLLEQQYSRLGGLASLGQQSAAGVGTAGMQTGVNVATLLGQQGQAQAGGILGKANAQAAAGRAFPQALGFYAGLGGFNTPSPGVTGNEFNFSPFGGTGSLF